MKSWPVKGLLLAGAASLLVALPALGQEQDVPQSLLPPGFGDPEALPPPVEAPPPESNQTAEPDVDRGPAPIRETPTVEETDELEEDELDPLAPSTPLNYFTVPEGLTRSVEQVGALRPGNFGLPADAFGRSNGAWLNSLMAETEAPLPSRWLSMLLRRTLLSELQAPPLVHPVDFVAARADLLVRMGEADAARILVQSVDPEVYTPRMIEAAAATALATADVAGLCPLVGPAASSDAVWRLAEAMCAALEGEPARAVALVDEARRLREVRGVDFLLAEKVIGAGTGARRAATIEWEEVGSLTPWRFGLASATGASIPERLIDSAPLAMQAWFARAAMIPLEQRLAAAATAAALGVFSSHSLTEIYALMLDRTDPAEAAGTVGARLRTAWTAPQPAERLQAMRSLWEDEPEGLAGQARLILTAAAAARVAPAEAQAADAARLIASMLSAGFDREAGRWAAIVEENDDEAAWALLAVGAPQASVDTSAGRIGRYADQDDSRDRRRSQLLVAALAGLGRLDLADASRLGAELGADLGRESRWSAAIDAAVRSRQPGTVVLLSALGLQTGDWSAVPPSHLFRIVRALRAVGLDKEARMIGAEAVARL